MTGHDHQRLVYTSTGLAGVIAALDDAEGEDLRERRDDLMAAAVILSRELRELVGRLEPEPITHPDA